MKSLQRWLWGLWAWWALSAMVVAAIVVAGWYYSLTAFLTDVASHLDSRIAALSSAFRAVGEKQSTLVLNLRHDVLTHGLTQKQLSDTRAAAAPLFSIYYVDSHGHPLLSGDTHAAPAWMLSLANRLDMGSMAVFRPLPLGMDIDLSTQTVPPPPDFLTAALRGGEESLTYHPENKVIVRSVSPFGDSYLFADADLHYLFGQWLVEQSRLIGFGQATLRRIDHTEQWRTHDARTAHVDVISALRSSSGRFSETVDSIPFEGPWAFDGVEVSLDVAYDVATIRYRWLLVGGTCAAVLLGFAVSLGLAATAIRKDFAAAHVRANFTAMVSHELKTPVAAICLTTEILQHKLVDDPAKIDEYHILLNTEAVRLRRLIDNVMRLFGLGGHPALEPTDVASVVQQAMAESGDVPLDMPADLSKALMEREAAVRAMANLIENAFKYAKDVQMEVRDTRNQIVVDVLDRGPGIPPRLRQAVFEPYFRVQDEERRDKPGTGLGLALVKVCMERQAGTVKVLERPGGGSIFRLTFRKA